MSVCGAVCGVRLMRACVGVCKVNYSKGGVLLPDNLV